MIWIWGPPVWVTPLHSPERDLLIWPVWTPNPNQWWQTFRNNGRCSWCCKRVARIAVAFVASRRKSNSRGTCMHTVPVRCFAAWKKRWWGLTWTQYSLTTLVMSNPISRCRASRIMQPTRMLVRSDRISCLTPRCWTWEGEGGDGMDSNQLTGQQPGQRQDKKSLWIQRAMIQQNR